MEDFPKANSTCINAFAMTRAKELRGDAGYRLVGEKGLQRGFQIRILSQPHARLS